VFFKLPPRLFPGAQFRGGNAGSDECASPDERRVGRVLLDANDAYEGVQWKSEIRGIIVW
jgi:hypothetical protein